MAKYNPFKLKDNFLNYIEKVSPSEYSSSSTKREITGFTFKSIQVLAGFATKNAQLEPYTIGSGVSPQECIADTKFIVNYLFDNSIELEIFDELLSHIFDFNISSAMKNICIEHLMDKRGLSVQDIRQLIKSKGVLGSTHSWNLIGEYEAKCILKEKELIDSSLGGAITSQLPTTANYKI